MFINRGYVQIIIRKRYKQGGRINFLILPPKTIQDI